MPKRLLGAYVEMVPVLKAQESLQRYSEHACASTQSKKGQRQAKSVIRGWERLAFSRGNARRTRKPKSMEEMKALMATMGIPVEVVKKRA